MKIDFNYKVNARNCVAPNSSGQPASEHFDVSIELDTDTSTQQFVASETASASMAKGLTPAESE